MAHVESEPMPLPKPKRSYPWDVWTDGETRVIVAGVDFTGKAEAFRNRLYDVAGKRDMKATVSAFTVPTGLTLEELREDVANDRLSIPRYEELAEAVLGGNEKVLRVGTNDGQAEYAVEALTGLEGRRALRFRFVPLSALDDVEYEPAPAAA